MPKFTKRDFASADFLEEIKKVKQEFLEMAKGARAVSKALQEAKGFKAFTENAKKAAAATSKLTDSEKKLIAAEKRLAFETSKAGKERAKLNEQTRRATAENKKLALSQLTAAKSTNRFGNAIKSFLFKANFLANVMSNLVSVIGRQLIRAVKNAVNIIKEFDKSTARLSSVLGKNKEEIEDLTKLSKQLGATTQFTTRQITGLEIELAKLGFTIDEIIASTPGILSFATATGADLAEAAKTAGAAVRIFGLDASETEDAVATLAVATTKSGLTFEHFNTILSTAGPVAKAYGFSLEDVVALTGELASKGFEANKAATATRNILLNLADANGALAKALGKPVNNLDDLIDGLVTLDEKGIDLATTLELTDKRSVAAFSTFLSGAESVRVLRDGISDVNDELQIMVDKQLDTIAGDIDLLKSAWEGFILALSSEGGVFRSVLQFLTNAVLQVGNLDLAFNKFHKQTGEQLARSFTLLQSLTNKQGQQFQSVLESFSTATVAQLQISKSIIVDLFADVRKVNQKEAEALFNELVRQRQSTVDQEIQALIAKNDRITAEEGKAQKLRELAAGEAAKKAAKAAERLPQVLTEAGIKFTKEEQAIFDELIRDINEQFGILAPMTEEELEILNDIVLDNADFLSKEISKKREELDKATLDATIERVDKEIEEENRLARTLVEIEEEKRGLIQQGANELFSFLSGLTDRRIQKAEEEAEQGIISEKQLADEKARLAKRAAILQKAQALFNIGISTAEGVIKYTSNPLTLPLVPFVIAVGLASAAAVLAKPLPKFEKGTKSSPEGVALVGERGSELLIHNGHVGLTPDVPTLMDLQKGTEVVPADVTNQLLKYSAIASGLEGSGDDNTILMLMGEMKGIKQAIKDKPVSGSYMTPEGILTATHRGNTTIKNLDKYYK